MIEIARLAREHSAAAIARLSTIMMNDDASDPTYAKRWDRKLEWYKAMDLEPNGAENDKGERLVTSQNRNDGAIDSAQIRQQVRDVFEF